MNKQTATAGVASTLVGFLIGATLILAVTSGVILSYSTDVFGDSRTEKSTNLRAEQLLDQLVSEPGEGWVDVDELIRLGFRFDDASGMDLAKVRQLQGAQLEAQDNGYLDYEEAKIAFGLTESEQFHLRIRPLVTQADIGNAYESKRVAYIAHWNGPLTTSVNLLQSPEAALAQAQTGLNVMQSAKSVQERTQLQALGVTNNNLITLTPTSPVIGTNVPLVNNLLVNLGVSLVDGDIYPDNKQYLDNVFPSQIGKYDIIIVGSDVLHSSLTSSVTKNAIRDWVLDGGNIAVMGSYAQSTQWLEPLFSVGTKNINGAPTAPDWGHPLLQSPNALDWSHYGNSGSVWDIQSQGANAHLDDFQHVVVSQNGDILTISNTQSFGDGRILLTSYSPGQIQTALGQAEALAFLDNVLTQMVYSDVGLEYGLLVPNDRDIHTASRTSTLIHPDLGTIPVRVELLYWIGSV